MKPGAKEQFNDIVRMLVAVFIPPLAVALQVGLTTHFWLNIVLTLCGWIPGIIHAWLVIVFYNDDDDFDYYNEV